MVREVGNNLGRRGTVQDGRNGTGSTKMYGKEDNGTGSKKQYGKEETV